MKKLFATALAGVTLTATLAACGSSSSSSSTTRSTASAASTSMSTSASAPAASSRPNIVQTAVAAGEFKTLVALVKQAGLAGALSGQVS
jgi:uncharacterized surface protein with fasciclin (FAS1) repeats